MKFNIFLFIIAIVYSVFAANVNNTISNLTDIYSVFKYEDGIEYFENLNCNSDNDCPERASCIGNKCFTSFYCKKGDKSTCSLFVNLCDGKSCYKSDYSCNKDEDCLEGKCHDLGTGKKFCSTSIDEYSTGLFRYEDAETYFKKIDFDCKDGASCPNHSFCKCQLNKFDDCRCAGSIYCNNNKTDCSFVNDEKKGITDNVEIFNFPERVNVDGLIRSIVVSIYYIVLSVVFCACTYLCFLIYNNRKKGLKEESGPNLYILTKRAIIVLFIMEIVTIILRFIRYISWYDYDICYNFHYNLEDNEESMSEKSNSTLLEISHIL